MVTDYNRGDVAKLYQRAKTHLWRKQIEEYSFLKLIGDVRGKTVLDIACGEGHYTRLLSKAGAAQVVGLDISERMIELARKEEAREPLGIEYLVEDARTIVRQRSFDLVVAAYLLVYARNRDDLAEMCRGLASRVREGGRFVTIVTSPGLYTRRPLPDLHKYGCEIRQPDHVYEGVPIELITLVDDQMSLTIENYYLPLEAYSSGLRAVGLTDLAVHQPECDPSTSESISGFWDDFMDAEVFLLLECTNGTLETGTVRS